ncbi:PfkB family carbohydrate kinase [Leifsonia sp. PS1209]|uniref:PfkB family carbohydrate kinase n=1 Tax=Leifsonia sp. PS1209 TaxID=2724914 RepID=UPI001442E0E7|nr:PfkB family carbohydrate kinase [Leifsonia sp. PS1209]QIZ99875.1 ribokinase [Leifsonia sp. PS1209]
MSPTLFASGFATVDVVLGDPLAVTAGGTAVNVTLAMESLGWSTGFAGTIGDDPAGDYLHDYLADRGVYVDHLTRHPAWTTPVVVQKRVRGDHEWRFSCPVCGARFAKHRPGPAAIAESIALAIPAPDVYFFDRATLFGIRLAEIWGAQGTTVVFEPAGLGRPFLFRRAAEAASLIKYSEERGPAFASQLNDVDAVLVETLGSAGARYRLSDASTFSDVLPAFAVDQMVDSAGAGDWTTAGLLQRLGRNGDIADALERPTTIRDAVQSGQRFGADACSWQGVRPESMTELPACDIEAFVCPRVIREGQLLTV